MSSRRNIVSQWKMFPVATRRLKRPNKQAKRRQYKNTHRMSREEREGRDEPVGKGVGRGGVQPARRKPHSNNTQPSRTRQG